MSAITKLQRALIVALTVTVWLSTARRRRVHVVCWMIASRLRMSRPA